MFNIFEGLDKMGIIVDESIDIYSDATKGENDTAVGAEAQAELNKIKAEDILYYHEYECPVCDNKFQNTTVKLRKSKYLRSDSDLKMYYDPIDPMYYDIVLCPVCGYAALTSTFKKLTTAQADRIKKKVSPHFKSSVYPLILTTEMAIERYKLALLCAVVKLAKDGEKGFLCLKLAWLYRDIKNEEAEQSTMEKALNGFTAAFQKEDFPIMGIDQHTLMYIIADLYRRTGDKANSLRYLGRLLGDRTAASRIKDRAMDLKMLINKENPPPKPAPKAKRRLF